MSVDTAGLAERGIRALLVPRDRMSCISPAVVIVDRCGEFAVVVLIAMRRGETREAQADIALGLRVTEAEPRDRKDEIGQTENRRDLVDLVADHADRTGAEAGGFRAQDHGLHRERGIDACIEETFERSVPNRLAAHLADALQPPCITEEDEEHRRVCDPWHGRKQFADRRAFRRIAQAHDRGLLEIRLCRRAQRSRN